MAARKLGILLASVAMAFGEIALMTQNANASLPNPDGGDCSTVGDWSVPSAGKIKITWKTTCVGYMSEITEGMTVQAGSKVLYANALTCYNVKTCTKSVTVSDPSGTQSWSNMDEVQTRWLPADSDFTRGKYWVKFSH